MDSGAGSSIDAQITKAPIAIKGWQQDILNTRPRRPGKLACVVGTADDKWISVVIFGGSKTKSIKVSPLPTSDQFESHFGGGCMFKQMVSPAK